MSVSKVFAHFETITRIPHCSRQAGKLGEYLADFARKRGYEVLTDDAGNILARKGDPTLCLQGHYDMVCVGKAPEIETVEEDGWLRALDSSLGADDGIAVAMMMALMDEGAEAEFLLTADEEVGLVGAKALRFDLKSTRLLNLDSEEEGVVLIGCAGGVDSIATTPLACRPDPRPAWRIRIEGLPGGHSGVDIDKGIPNAIKEIAATIAGIEGAGLVSFAGGERRNAIPTAAEAIVRCEGRPSVPEGVRVGNAPDAPAGSLERSDALIALLATAPTGVVEENRELSIPETSLNLAIVSLGEGEGRIEYSLRSMDDAKLDALYARTAGMLERYGFATEARERYPAWKPRRSPFVAEVERAVRRRCGSVETTAIHAGLECGILSEKYPGIEMASIGPTIENPHSIRERVKLASVVTTYRIVWDLLEMG